MASSYNRDAHALPTEPGAAQSAGPTAKVKRVPRATFRASVGHGSASPGTQVSGTGQTGDPTLSFRKASTWASALGRTGKFGTQDQVGKRPLNYTYHLSAFYLE